MRTETPVAVKLQDYTPYPFTLDAVDLRFDLGAETTIVKARLSITPLGTGPMRLDGEALKLRYIAVAEGGSAAKPLDLADFTTDARGLILHTPPAGAFVLETEVEISPKANTALSGLYLSGGRLCTQCEAEGFRRITYYPDRPDVMSAFRVRMEGPKAEFPILLSNGTPGASGDLPDGRHFAEWVDPHKKPAYLFALCAGDYDVLRDTFTTMSGKTVDLGIHVDKGDAARAAWAMDSLKRSMRWDEEVYGREYDLGVFNIVAVRDFNFGAMENKGLNIFNSAYVLADEATATDFDFEAIESIVAHEYFHNWTGNRITCRDWFQLCLKEGLTVFRDQNFSADMRSRAVQRIKDVIRLRARQFGEDAGPLAHAVRPDTYGAIDNLYTATVYEKGAELIGMLRRMIGPKKYREGMDLYFERHDGQAVTIEDFYACFEAVTGRDFSEFRRWYAQAGTPELRVSETWDEASATLSVTFAQSTPPTPGQKVKHPVPIPLLCAVLDGKGGHVAVNDASAEPFLHVLDKASVTLDLRLPPGSSRPILSVGRDFSAPVRITRSLSRSERIALVNAETDPFNRWDGLQTLIKEEMLALSDGSQTKPDHALVEAVASSVRGAIDDPAFAALLTRLPEVGELFLERQPADPVALAAARQKLQGALCKELAGSIAETLAAPAPAPYHPGAEQASVRALRTAFIGLLGASATAEAASTLAGLYERAPNMTESLATLRALTFTKGEARNKALSHFEQVWSGNALVMDKWFSVQASTGTAEDVQRLVAHPAFDLKNPNRVRAVIAAFAMQNLAAFHAPDGSGYRAVEATILAADKVNPALGARLMTAFEQWRVLEPRAGAEAKACLKRMIEAGLSENAMDIAGRALGSEG
ncbi:aminopeptidase N [Hyphomonas sp.]|uniref:aminopeptidase N n=1 Tax=Hyphomonas sp. TaxID=87 RepID=UPI0025BDF4B8|nr:aminopeptidase N [Hyphomonas sp.]MBI1398719.1 aminopeptidase N [Hyphomonas sp.]